MTEPVVGAGESLRAALEMPTDNGLREAEQRAIGARFVGLRDSAHAMLKGTHDEAAWQRFARRVLEVIKVTSAREVAHEREVAALRAPGDAGPEPDRLEIVMRDLANGIATALREKDRSVNNDLRYSLIWQSLSAHGWDTVGVRSPAPVAPPGCASSCHCGKCNENLPLKLDGWTPDAPMNCPRCTTGNDVSDVTCWRCGANLGVRAGGTEP